MKIIIKNLVFLFFLFFGYESFSQENIKINSNPYHYIVYDKVDDAPEFPGGEKGLLEFYKLNSKYKISNDTKGGVTIYFSIVINEKGEPIDFKILIGNDKELRRQTKSLVDKMPSWTAGKLDGKVVKVQKRLSITYIID